MRLLLARTERAARATAISYYLRQVLALVFVLGSVFYTAIAYFGQIDADGDPWKTGDWLINYGGGFVRRGLFGSLLLGLHLPAAWSLWLLYVVQTACYLILVAYLVRFLHRERYSWWAIALTCSPAAIPFVAYDTDGAYHKEILIFVPLVLLAWAVRATNMRRWHVYSVGSLALLLYGLAVFSWEAAAFTLPMFVYLEWRLRQKLVPGGRFPVFLIAATVAVAIGGLGSSILAHGDAATVSAIKSALQARGLPTWQPGTGAIDWLSVSGGHALRELTRHFPLYLAYIPLAILASLPIVLSDWWRQNRAWGIAFVVGVIPLFLVGWDYGRWISLLVIGSCICIATQDSGAIATRWKAWMTLPLILLWCLPCWIALKTADPGHLFAPLLLRLLAGWL